MGDDCPIPTTRAAAADSAAAAAWALLDATNTQLTEQQPACIALSSARSSRDGKENKKRVRPLRPKQRRLRRRDSAASRPSGGSAASASASPSHSRTLSAVFPPKQQSAAGCSPQAAAARSSGLQPGWSSPADDALFCYTAELSLSQAWERLLSGSSSSSSCCINDSVRQRLSSSRWAEVAEAVSELRAAVCRFAESGCAEGETRVRAACWALAAAPGLAVNNLQLLRCVSEALTALLSLPGVTVSAAFVRCVLQPVASKMADKKTLNLLSPLLLSLAAACSPRVVQHCVTLFLIPHCRSARVQEQLLGLLASLLSSFSLLALSFPALLALIRSQCEHQQQPVRAKACELLAAVYAQCGLPFRELLLAAVSQSAAQQAEEAFAQVDREKEQTGGWRAAGATAAAPLLQARGEGSALAAVTLEAAFPKLELCSALGDGVLQRLRDSSWRERAAALDEVLSTLRSLRHRVSLREAALACALSPLLQDSNRIIAAQALSLLRLLIADVGESLLRWKERLMPALVAAAGEAQRQVREEAGRALEAWLRCMGVQPVLRHLRRGLEAGGLSRREVLKALVQQQEAAAAGSGAEAEAEADADWTELAGGVLDGLCDRAAEVRQLAERLLERIVCLQPGCLSAVLSAMQRLKPAFRMQVEPVVERCRQSSRKAGGRRRDGQPDSLQTQPPRTTAAAAAAPPLATAPSATSSSSSAASSSLKRRLEPAATSRSQPQAQPQPQPVRAGDREVDGLPQASASGCADAACHPFLLKPDAAARQRRLLRDGRRLQTVHFRDWSADEKEELAAALQPLVSASMLALMLSADFTSVLAAVSFFSAQLSACPAAVQAIADLLLRWASTLLAEANPKLLLALLQLLSSLLSSLSASGLRLSEAEMQSLLPFVVERALGHSVSKVRKDAAALLLSLPRLRLFPAGRLLPFVVSGLDSKNKRVVSESCDCIAALWGGGGASAGAAADDGGGRQAEVVSLSEWGEMKRALPALALLLSTADSAVRLAALSAIVSAHAVIGEQLWLVLSRDAGAAGGAAGGRQPVPEKSLAMIEERLKRRRLDAMPLHAIAQPAPAAPPPASPSSSRIPSLSSLSSSLASLEAMQATLSSTAHCASFSPLAALPPPAADSSPARAIPPHLPSLLMSLQAGDSEEATQAALSLPALLAARRGGERLVEHAPIVVGCMARLMRTAAAGEGGAEQRRGRTERLLAALRLLLRERELLEAVPADSTAELLQALLALPEPQTADAAGCMEALLDAQPMTRHFSIVSSQLLSAVLHSPPTAASCSSSLLQLQSLLVRWSALLSRSGLELPLTLSALHRLLLAIHSGPAYLTQQTMPALLQVVAAVVGQADHLKLKEVIRGFPADAAMAEQVRRLLGQDAAAAQEQASGQLREERQREPQQQPARTEPSLPPAQRRLVGRKSRQLYAQVLDDGAETADAAGLSLSLDQLMLTPARSLPPSPGPAAAPARSPPPSPSPSRSPLPRSTPASAAAASYLERFQQMQQQMRQAAAAPPVSPRRTAPLSQPLRLSPPPSPLRCSPPPAADGCAAVSSVSSVLREASAFEAMKARMRARQPAETPAAAAPAPQLPSHSPSPPLAASASSSSVSSVTAVLAAGCSSGQGSNSSAVSALRARLAAVNAANARFGTRE